MAHKIVVSKPGYDADTETDPNNLIYSSDYDSLKYYASGEVEIDMSTSENIEVTVVHNLGYVPFFVAYSNYMPLVTDFSHLPFYFAEFGGWFTMDVYSTTTTLFFTIKRSFTVENTFTVAYKIFRNNTGL